MPIQSNPQRGRGSLHELLAWLNQLVSAAQAEVVNLEPNSPLLLRMDAVWRGQAWFPQGDEDAHLLVLLRGLLECRSPLEAIERYLDAKAGDAQADFSELLEDVQTPEDFK